jgi:hypothetical protein
MARIVRRGRNLAGSQSLGRPRQRLNGCFGEVGIRFWWGLWQLTAEGAVVGLLQKAKEKALEVTEGELANAGVAKVREILSLFNEAMPLLEEAGCAPSGVDVDIGLPPKVVANFATTEVSEEKIARITADHPEKKFACAILKALAKGARLQKGVEVGRMQASTLAVELGLAPCLKLSFVRA